MSQHSTIEKEYWLFFRLIYWRLDDAAGHTFHVLLKKSMQMQQEWFASLDAVLYFRSRWFGDTDSRDIRYKEICLNLLQAGLRQGTAQRQQSAIFGIELLWLVSSHRTVFPLPLASCSIEEQQRSSREVRSRVTGFILTSSWQIQMALDARRRAPLVSELDESNSYEQW